MFLSKCYYREYLDVHGHIPVQKKLLKQGRKELRRRGDEMISEKAEIQRQYDAERAKQKALEAAIADRKMAEEEQAILRNERAKNAARKEAITLIPAYNPEDMVIVEEKTKKTSQKLVFLIRLTGLSFACCVALGLVAHVFYPLELEQSFRYEMWKQISLNGVDDPRVERWKHLGAEDGTNGLECQYFLYNISNPHEMLAGNIPEVDEVGPFRFLRKSEKYSIRFDGDVVTYSSRYFFNFIEDPDEILPDLSTELTTINMGYQLLVSTFRSWGSSEMHLVPMFAASKLRNLLQNDYKKMLQRWKEYYPQGQLKQLSSRILRTVESELLVNTAEATLATFFRKLKEAVIKDTALSPQQREKKTAVYWMKGTDLMVTDAYFRMFLPENIGSTFNPNMLDENFVTYLWSKEFKYSIVSGFRW